MQESFGDLNDLLDDEKSYKNRINLLDLDELDEMMPGNKKTSLT